MYFLFLTSVDCTFDPDNSCKWKNVEDDDLYFANVKYIPTPSGRLYDHFNSPDGK